MECAQQKYILRLHCEARETLLSLLSFPAGTVDAATQLTLTNWFVAF